MFSAYDALLDLARNRDALTAMGHEAPLSALAYPYGETSIALKESLPPRYRTARRRIARPQCRHGRSRAIALLSVVWRRRLGDSAPRVVARRLSAMPG
ncbi:MAG: hypothetical protein WDM79_09285 [Terricaulis sp.]